MWWTVVELLNCWRNLVAVRGRASRGGAKRDSPGQRILTNLTKSIIRPYVSNLNFAGEEWVAFGYVTSMEVTHVLTWRENWPKI